jgi:hypothetical protein
MSSLFTFSIDYIFEEVYLLPVAIEIMKSEWGSPQQGDFTIPKANASLLQEIHPLFS